MSREIINGVPNQFGRHEVEKTLPYYMPSEGLIKTLVYPFFFDALPVANADDAGAHVVPGHSFIVSAYIYVEEDFAGGTSYDFGMIEADGSAIDPNGIDEAIAEAALEDNDWIECDGDLIGATLGAEPGMLLITDTGSFTAGKGKVILRYIENNLPREAT